MPQGSIISPILSNLYLHELDLFMERKMVEANQSGEENAKQEIRNPKYANLSQKISSRLRKIKNLKSNPEQNKEELKETHLEYLKLIKERRKTKSTTHNPLSANTIKYERYADD